MQDYSKWQTRHLRAELERIPDIAGSDHFRQSIFEAVTNELANRKDEGEDLRDDWQALRRKLRGYYEERKTAGAYGLNSKGELTKAGNATAFEFLVGVHVGLMLSGSTNGLGPLVFLASVRGAEDATTIKD